jgi:hypothetical protein
VGIDNPTVVDAVSTSKDGTRVSLTIMDAEDWSDETSHLFSLQAKLNSYFDFIQTGQLIEEYPEATGKPLLISVVFRVPPTPKAKGLLEKADALAPQLGARIGYEVYPGSDYSNSTMT